MKGLTYDEAQSIGTEYKRLAVEHDVVVVHCEFGFGVSNSMFMGQ